MIIRTALTNGRNRLSHTSPSPALDARLLMQHLLGGVSHASLIAHDDEALTAEQEERYQHLIEQAAAMRPIPYLIGHAPFMGLDFMVSPAVLIPRPETEQLVETAVNWAKSRGHIRFVDVGTGSGCIAVSLARQLPQAEATAVDISHAALVVAHENGRRHAPSRLNFWQGHLLRPTAGAFDLIAANLPYVTREEWTRLDDGVKLHEPSLALIGGEDGLDLIEELLRQAVNKLNSNGLILLEIGWKQGASAMALARRFFPTAVIDLLTDFSGHDRIVKIEAKS